MWIWIANKLAKFHAKWLNRSENIPKRFRGATFLKHPVCKKLTQRWRWTCRVGSTFRRGRPSCRRGPSRRSWRTSRRRRRRRWGDRSRPARDSGPSNRSRRRTADTSRASGSWVGSRPYWSSRTTLSRGNVKDITTQWDLNGPRDMPPPSSLSDRRTNRRTSPSREPLYGGGLTL